MLRRSWELWREGRNPYREDLAGLLAQLDDVKVGKAKSVLLQPRLRAPRARRRVGRRRLVVRRPRGDPHRRVRWGSSTPTSPSRPTSPAGGRRPRNRSGREVEPWANEAIAPAGGVRSSAADLAVLLRAMLDRTRRRRRGARPGGAVGGRLRIGAGWLTGPMLRRTVTWHNGGTGGFRSFVGIDRDHGVGVALVSASTRSVDGAAARLLAEAGDA